jgi:hypothetical protein
MKCKNYLTPTTHTTINQFETVVPLSSPPPWDTRASRTQIKPGWWNTRLRWPGYPARGLAKKATTIRSAQSLMSLQKIKNLSGCW